MTTTREILHEMQRFLRIAQRAPDNTEWATYASTLLLQELLEAILGKEKASDLGTNARAVDIARQEIQRLRQAIIAAHMARDEARNRAEQYQHTADHHKQEADRAYREYNQLKAKVDQLRSLLRGL